MTLDTYLDVLERLAVVIRVGAWTAGETRREVRRPKIHMVDTGLACALRDLDVGSFDADADPTAFGGLLESFAFNELVRAAPLQDDLFSLWHRSGRDGREIDIVAESRRRLVAVEVKASAHGRAAHARRPADVRAQVLNRPGAGAPASIPAAVSPAR